MVGWMVLMVAKRTHNPRKRARWLIFEGDRVLVAEKKPPSSKKSVPARFRRWWWRKESATLENKPACSFSRVIGVSSRYYTSKIAKSTCWVVQHTRTRRKPENRCVGVV